MSEPATAPRPSRSWLDRIASWVRWLENGLSYVAGAAIIAIMLLTLVDVLGRALFSNPLTGTYETIEGFLLGLAVWLGLAQGERNKEHVAVDFLSQKLPGRAGWWVRVLLSTFAAAIFAAISYAAFERAVDRWSVIIQNAVIPLPMGIGWLGVAVGAAALCLRIVLELVLTVAGKDARPDDDELTQAEAQDV